MNELIIIALIGVVVGMVMLIDKILRYNGVDLFGKIADKLDMSYTRRVRVRKYRVHYTNGNIDKVEYRYTTVIHGRNE